MAEEKVENQPVFLAPPVFPDAMFVRLSGGLTHLAFVSFPDPKNRNNYVIIGDIVAAPAFLQDIAEQCITVLRISDPDFKVNEERIKSNLAIFQDKFTKSESGKL